MALMTRDRTASCLPRRWTRLWSPTNFNIPPFLTLLLSSCFLIFNRTQNKIEIVGRGPNSIRRLQELISLDNLPAEYGGTAPDLYKFRSNTEYVKVSKKGITKTLIVEAGKRLEVDSYVTTGPIDILVTSTDVTAEESAAAAALPEAPPAKSKLGGICSCRCCNDSIVLPSPFVDSSLNTDNVCARSL
jgi:hypothetical protein